MILLSKLTDFLILLLFNSYVPGSAKIGKGSRFAYGGIGVVIHSDAIIGSGCIIGQGVTIGAKEGYASKIKNKCPIIGDNVYLSAGCRVLGDIEIGSNSIIGANSVVLSSCEKNSVLVGVPAKLLRTSNTEYRAIC
jgi:serine O-acetyltransferase